MLELDNIDVLFANKVLERVLEKVKEIKEMALSYHKKLKTIAQVMGYGEEFKIYPKDIGKKYFSLNIDDLERIAKKVDLLITYTADTDHVVAYWRGERVVDTYPIEVIRFKRDRDFLSYVDNLYVRAEEIRVRKEVEETMRKARELAEKFGIDLNEVVEEVRREINTSEVVDREDVRA